MAVSYTYDKDWYANQKKTYNESVDKNTASQVADAQASANNQLKQAYIQKLQNQKALNQNLAQAGIRGGATETSNLKLATNYGNSRNTINSDLSSNIKSINQTAEANKLSYAQEMDSAEQQTKENLAAEQRAAQREDEQLAYDRNQAYYTALYATSYDVKSLQKALASATNDLQRQVINARIAYIRQHKKGY